MLYILEYKETYCIVTEFDFHFRYRVTSVREKCVICIVEGLQISEKESRFTASKSFQIEPFRPGYCTTRINVYEIRNEEIDT